MHFSLFAVKCEIFFPLFLYRPEKICYLALWPRKYIYVVNVIRYGEPEQIYFPLRVLSFSFDLCTSNITASF